MGKMSRQILEGALVASLICVVSLLPLAVSILIFVTLFTFRSQVKAQFPKQWDRLKTQSPKIWSQVKVRAPIIALRIKRQLKIVWKKFKRAASRKRISLQEFTTATNSRIFNTDAQTQPTKPIQTHPNHPKQPAEQGHLENNGVDNEASRDAAVDSEIQLESQKALLRQSAPTSGGSDTTDCRTCGNLVARAAKSCPHCGERKPSLTTEDLDLNRRVLLGSVSFLAICLFAFLIIRGPSMMKRWQTIKKMQELDRVSDQLDEVSRQRENLVSSLKQAWGEDFSLETLKENDRYQELSQQYWELTRKVIEGDY